MSRRAALLLGAILAALTLAISLLMLDRYLLLERLRQTEMVLQPAYRDMVGFYALSLSWLAPRSFPRQDPQADFDSRFSQWQRSLDRLDQDLLRLVALTDVHAVRNSLKLFQNRLQIYLDRHRECESQARHLNGNCEVLLQTHAHHARLALEQVLMEMDGVASLLATELEENADGFTRAWLLMPLVFLALLVAILLRLWILSRSVTPSSPDQTGVVESDVSGDQGGFDTSHDDRDPLFRAFFENAHQPMFIKQSDGRYLIVNRALSVRFGVPSEAIVGLTDRELLGAEYSPSAWLRDQSVLETGRLIETRELIRKQPEYPELSRVIRFPLRDSSGGIRGICGMCIDEIGMAPNQVGDDTVGLLFRALTRWLPDTVLRLDPAGALVHWYVPDQAKSRLGTLTVGADIRQQLPSAAWDFITINLENPPSTGEIRTTRYKLIGADQGTEIDELRMLAGNEGELILLLRHDVEGTGTQELESSSKSDPDHGSGGPATGGASDSEAGSKPVISDQSVPAPSQLAGTRILLVDSRRETRERLTDLLAEEQLDPVQAENADQALALLHVGQYPLVVMAIQALDQGDISLIERIRQDRDNRKIPLLLVLDRATEVERTRGVRLGANRVLLYGEVERLLYDSIRHFLLHREPESHPEASMEFLRLEQALPGVRVDVAVQRLGGNLALYHKLLVRFADRQGGLSQQLDGLLANQQLVEAERLVHTTKGLSATLGAFKLQRAALQLERAIRERIALETPLARFRDELDEFLGMLANLPPTEQIQDRALPLDSMELKRLLDQLKEKLSSFDASSTDTLIELISSSGGTRLQGSLRELQSPMENFDFFTALQMLEALDLSELDELADSEKTE